MFQSQSLEEFLATAHTIENSQEVFVEWNQNRLENIEKFGNYRYRPGTSDTLFGIITPVYDPNDEGGYYTGATDSDTVVDFGVSDFNSPEFYVAPKKKMNLLYSLEDCFKHNRPRSGINKMLYLGTVGASYGYNQYFDSLTTRRDLNEPLTSVNIARRPRYYMSSRFDAFKYWTSYRTESEITFSPTVVGETPSPPITREFGISQNLDDNSSLFYIFDCAPFVVYKNNIATNKIVVKVQTNVGEEDLGPFRIGNTNDIPDPLFGYENQTTPQRWSIQVLKDDNSWNTIISFNENSLRMDGSPIIGSDGQLEIEYGLEIPTGFEDTFILVREIFNTNELPFVAPIGYSYLLKQNENDKGTLYVSDGGSYQVYPANYSWSISQNNITRSTHTVKKLTDPEYFLENSKKVYREIEVIKGIRIVVDTMNKINSTFDLIEISPRIFSNITEKTISFSVQKTMSDLGNNSMPTGSLLASTGSISIFDEDFAFNENNIFDPETSTGSIISELLQTRAKFILFDVVKNVDDYDYYIPIKTLYSEGFPQVSDGAVNINISLRDLFYFFESNKAPEMLLTNVSMSYAITVLLDSIGFSNYVFKRTSKDNDLIIPFFFVNPDNNIAETLQQLTIASQSAMFFDEYNNFVVMYKNYILPTEQERETDLVLYGQEEVFDGETMLPNIVNISSQEKKVYNSGAINYTTRYIQKSIGSIIQAPYIDEYKTYVYKPVLLWEVEGQEKTKTINDLNSKSTAYTLSAMPLKTSLTSQVPQVINNQVVNNILDFGENVYWAGNYQGYFYANGEVIKYDAIEYYVAGLGNVWIQNNQEYQEYFAKLRFNGKMYPTGRVRIYAEIFNGEVKEHGRGQFDTNIVSHPAGVEESTWVQNSNVRGCIQASSQYLFNTNSKIYYPVNMGIEKTGDKKTIGSNQYVAQDYANRSTRNGIIKNFMANTNITENEANYFKTVRSGSVQTSALVFNGPQLPNDLSPSDFVTYVYKPLDKPYKNFGTRVRVIGKIESQSSQDQTATGASNIYSLDQLSSTDPSKQVSISGGGGGIAIGLNKDTNVGYYYEIQALNQKNVGSYKNNTNSSKFNIIKSPQVTATNDEVTVWTEKQHDFAVSETITVSSLVDDNRKENNPQTTLNGEFTVTEVSKDRKSFRYKIDGQSVRSAKITAAHRQSNVITYTANNSFSAGQLVTISGITTSSFNLSSATILSASRSSFTVANTGTNESATVTSNSIATRVINVVQAKSSPTDNTLTEYTVDENIFGVGQLVNVTGLTSSFNGTNMSISKISSNIIQKNITAVSGNGTYVTYTTSTNHGYFPKQTVKVSGIEPTSYNWESIEIYDTPAPNQFRVASNVSASVTDANGLATVTEYIVSTKKSTTGTAADGTGEMQYVPLTTTSSNGGTASKDLDSDTVISDIFFYKIVSGENSAEILKKERTGNSVTLTTLREHSLVAGESVIISSVDAALNGTYVITSVTPKTISYSTQSSGTIPSTELQELGSAVAVNKIAIPEVLWRGLVGIIVDDGKFTSQSRLVANENTTVYDLSLEYLDVGSTRRFYLYLNDKQVATVDDLSPLPQYNNLALFVRGSSKCMFENVYAISDNLSDGVSKSLQLPVSKAFGSKTITQSEALRKYAVSGVVQNTYLSGINSESPPRYEMYFEEFGTIMREAAYFNIKYDRSFPALYAILAPTINRVQGYTTSGFFAGSYGAEFLIFNAADKNINLDDTTGNYLRILGISFTQNTSYSLTVDDFFKKNSDFSTAFYEIDSDPENYKALYSQIQSSRNKYGINEFVIETPYLQTGDAADQAMDWIIKKVMYPRKAVGVSTFATPHLQLGDIVTINYKSSGADIVSDESVRYVVYSIEYQKEASSSTTVYLAEV